MKAMIETFDRAAQALNKAAMPLLPTLARLVFAGVLLVYFWTSFATKLGEGALGLIFPSDGAYIQIFPRAMEAAGYDVSQLSLYHQLVVVAGMMAEVTLPALIVLGLCTRLAALGMAGFILVQSLTDIFGHGVGGEDLGRWFDAASGALILDQRSMWILLLTILILMGAGPLSLDHLVTKAHGKGAK